MQLLYNFKYSITLVFLLAVTSYNIAFAQKKFSISGKITDEQHLPLLNNAITSVTDSRTTWAGGIDEQHSIFFDEKGDLYIFCVSSYGFGGPNQKCGFLRIKNGESIFDPSYFFNISDFAISGIPN